MDALLPELQALEPAVRGDEALGVAVGGTRLVMAMQTIAAKVAKTSWTTFLAGKKTDFMTWPPDQVGSILRYLGAPSETAAMQELAVSELPEIVQNTQGDLPLVEKGRTDLIRTTVAEMTKKELGYGSTTPRRRTGTATRAARPTSSPCPPRVGSTRTPRSRPCSRRRPTRRRAPSSTATIW
jgi:hypothetical protein